MKNANHKGTPALAAVLRGVLFHAKRLTLLLCAAIAGAVLLALAPPLVLEGIVNRLATGQTVALGLALLYFATLVLAGLVDAAKEVLITMFGQKMTHALRSEMCAKLARLPADYFTRNEDGAITSRMVNDVDTVENLFAGGVISMAADVCKMLGIIVVIFVKSRGLGLIILLLAPLLFLLTRRFQRWMLAAQLQNRQAVGRVNSCIPETIRNIRMIRSLFKYDYMEHRYDAAIQQSYRSMEKSNLYDSIYSPIILLISSGVIALVMVLSALGGGMQSLFGMSVGTAVAVIAYVGQVFAPIESIGMEIQNIQSAVAGVRRINEFLAEEEKAPTLYALDCDRLKQASGPCVQLSRVDFAYELGRPVLQGLNLVVEPGEHVTLTGRTGAGKSTIFRLLLGLYSPQGGSVRIFGTQADHIPEQSKRRLFGYVEQTFHPVPGTIGDQITLHDPAITPEEMCRTARLVGLAAVIEALPGGYATPFRQAGFSQGQQQLLSIARAIAANPAILLLDEMTASLDTDTEQKVLAALRRAAQGRTVLSISHRLYGQMDSRLVMIA